MTRVLCSWVCRVTMLISLSSMHANFFSTTGSKCMDWKWVYPPLLISLWKQVSHVYTRVEPHTLTIAHDIPSTQICWSMLAIAVAVRIDIYGIFYALVLGLLMLVPRPPSKVHLMLWIFYLVFHGLLLVVQYAFLLGVPEGVCLYPDTERGKSVKRLVGAARILEYPFWIAPTQTIPGAIWRVQKRSGCSSPNPTNRYLTRTCFMVHYLAIEMITHYPMPTPCPSHTHSMPIPCPSHAHPMPSFMSNM